MLQTETHIGRYEIASELGRGAMGVVYLAQDPLVQRNVAIKTIRLPPDFSKAQEDEYHSRFLREAQSAGGLSHPGIVTVYEFQNGSDHGQPFIAMEYVAGRSLKELIESDGPGAPREVFAIVDAVADALHAAHEAGVVHRDVKPANILIRESDGAVKIADFGVARLRLADLTNTGATLGSPAYMAPERIRGLRADRRSDLFSLAVIFYECLCGERPFGGEDTASTLGAILHGAPEPITCRVPGLPAPLDAFFERALHKDPERRFADAIQFRQALAPIWRRYKSASRVAGTMDISAATHLHLPAPTTPEPAPAAIAPAEPTPTRWWSAGEWLPWIAGGVLLMLIGIGAGWLLRGKGDPAAGVPAPVAPPATADVLGTSPSDLPAVADDAGGISDLGDAARESLAAGDASVVEGTATELSSSTVTVAARPPPVQATPPVSAEPARRKTPAAAAPPTTAPPRAVAQAERPAEPTEPPIQDSPPAVADAAAEVPPQPVAEAPGRLELVARSGVKRGVLTLWIDGERVLTRELEGEQRGFRRFTRRIRGAAVQTLEESLSVAPGRHTLIARLEIDGKEEAFEETLDFTVEPGQERKLALRAGRILGPIGDSLALELD